MGTFEEGEIVGAVRFGSSDSRDADAAYVFASMPSNQDCKEFCDGKVENRNIVVVEDGVVRRCYKGLPDEVNNSIYSTYPLHDQSEANPVESPIKRIVPLKVVRATRIILSLASASHRDPGQEGSYHRCLSFSSSSGKRHFSSSQCSCSGWPRSWLLSQEPRRSTSSRLFSQCHFDSFPILVPVVMRESVVDSLDGP